jgi:hypothetical protein
MVAGGWSVGGLPALINACRFGSGGVGSAVQRSHRQKFAVQPKFGEKRLATLWARQTIAKTLSRLSRLE